MKHTPTLCIYHGNCADGFAAAWAVWKKHPDIEFFAGTYGQDGPDVTGHHVVMVDFSYPVGVIANMLTKAKSITIIDHHKTAQEGIQTMLDAGEIDGIFDMERSGAMLAWKWFHGDAEPPVTLLHIEDRDLWRFALPGTREIQASLFSYPYDFKIWDKLIMGSTQTLWDEGKVIERKHFKDVKELTTVNRRAMKIGGHHVWVANLPYTLCSDAAHLLAETPIYSDINDDVLPAFGATYFDRGDGKRVFSLRSIGDFDVSAIAKQYGGGGHKNAAGFTMDLGWEGNNTGKISDGFHTFDELYEHRHTLFAYICRMNPQLSWKSKLHDDGTMHEGWFIAGIMTPEGQATYHLPLSWWEKFENVKTLDNAPAWDGHTPADVLKRIALLN